MYCGYITKQIKKIVVFFKPNKLFMFLLLRMDHQEFSSEDGGPLSDITSLMLKTITHSLYSV